MGGHAIKEAVPFTYEEGLEIHSHMLNFFRDVLGKDIVYEIKIVGSWANDFSKKCWGDMDFVVQIPERSSPKSYYQYFKDRCFRTFEWGSGPVFNEGLGIISVPCKVHNKIHQVDLILTKNIRYAEWIHCVDTASKYSAAYRNILLMAFVYCKSFEPIEMYFAEDGNEIPLTWKREFLDIQFGLMRGMQTRRGASRPICKTRHTFDKVLITNNLLDIHMHIFGSATYYDTRSRDFESLFYWIKDKDPKCMWVFSVALKNFKRLKMEIPEEMLTYFPKEDIT